MRIYKSVLLSLLLSLKTLSVSAQIKLPKLVSDGMVMQRNAVVPMWGWAEPKEDIKISFGGEEYKTRFRTCTIKKDCQHHHLV